MIKFFQDNNFKKIYDNFLSERTNNSFNTEKLNEAKFFLKELKKIKSLNFKVIYKILNMKNFKINQIYRNDSDDFLFISNKNEIKLFLNNKYSYLDIKKNNFDKFNKNSFLDNLLNYLKNKSCYKLECCFFIIADYLKYFQKYLLKFKIKPEHLSFFNENYFAHQQFLKSNNPLKYYYDYNRFKSLSANKNFLDLSKRLKEEIDYINKIKDTKNINLLSSDNSIKYINTIYNNFLNHVKNCNYIHFFFWKIDLSVLNENNPYFKYIRKTFKDKNPNKYWDKIRINHIFPFIFFNLVCYSKNNFCFTNEEMMSNFFDFYCNDFWFYNNVYIFYKKDELESHKLTFHSDINSICKEVFPLLLILEKSYKNDIDNISSIFLFERPDVWIEFKNKEKYYLEFTSYLSSDLWDTPSDEICMGVYENLSKKIKGYEKTENEIFNIGIIVYDNCFMNDENWNQSLIYQIIKKIKTKETLTETDEQILSLLENKESKKIQKVSKIIFYSNHY